MDRIAAEAVAPWRFSMALLVTLAGLGLALAITGLVALVAYAVSQRQMELAIRLAIGATPQALLRMVVLQGSRFAAAGLATGLVLSLLLADRLSSLLFQIPSRDVVTFAGSAATLSIAVLVASVWSARRVMNVDPSHAMRAE
jgi:ABC-type antimicrobial peptide transport system permease subunit